MTGRCIRSRAPSASSPAVRRAMQAVLSKDTSPEIVFRKALHAAGLRFRKELRPVPSLKCKADVVFIKQKLCIFIDGCFWHRCSVHFKLPKSNSDWWKEKIASVVERDTRQTKLLKDSGWTVVRFWEHEVRDDVSRCVETIRRLLT
jgi:DNA mismatch endonuclease (patch repair protein)